MRYYPAQSIMKTIVCYRAIVLVIHRGIMEKAFTS